MTQLLSLDPATLAKRLEREKLARVAAEQLLEDKSRTLYKTTLEMTKQTAQLQSILDKARAGILYVDPAGFVRTANRGALLMFGREGSDIETLEILDFFPLEKRPEVTCFLDRLGTFADEDEALETEGQRLDGTCFPLSIGISHVEQDDAIWSVWICHNLSRVKRQEAERLRLERELGQANKLEALGTLASGIAHEINTPVQYVSDNAYFLKDALEDLQRLLKAYEAASAPRQNISVQTCAEDIDLPFLQAEIPSAFEQMIDGLQQISKITSAVKVFTHPGTQDKTSSDVNDLIETTATLCRNQWKYVAILSTDFDVSLPALACFPSELSQVFLNLLVNAAQAIEEQGSSSGSGEIHVVTRTQEGNLIIEFRDNGSGIAPDILPKIFDPFFTTKDVGRGTGQGLSLAHDIITRRHGGIISCQSQLGEGTTFTICLPLNPVANGEAA